MFTNLTIGQLLASLILLAVAIYLVSVIGHTTATLRQGLTALFLQLILTVSAFELVGYAHDAEYYVSAGLSIGDKVLGLGELTVGYTKISLPFLWFLLDASLGWHPLLAAIVLAIPVALIPAITATACRNLDLAQTAQTCAWLSVCLPPIVVWSPWLQREGLSFFLLSVLLLGMSNIYAGKWLSGAALSLLTTGLFLFTRGQLAILATFASLLAVLLTPKISVRMRATIAAVILLAGTIVLPVAWQSLYLGRTLELNLKSFAESGTLGITRTSYEFNTSIPGYTLNFFSSLFGPFPWEWDEPRWIVIGLDGIFFLAIAILMIFVYRKFPNIHRQFWLLLSPNILIFVGATLYLSNYGFNARIRAHAIILLLPLIAVGVRYLRDSLVQEPIDKDPSTTH